MINPPRIPSIRRADPPRKNLRQKSEVLLRVCLALHPRPINNKNPQNGGRSCLPELVSLPPLSAPFLPALLRCPATSTALTGTRPRSWRGTRGTTSNSISAHGRHAATSSARGGVAHPDDGGWTFREHMDAPNLDARCEARILAQPAGGYTFWLTPAGPCSEEQGVSHPPGVKVIFPARSRRGGIPANKTMQQASSQEAGGE